MTMQPFTGDESTMSACRMTSLYHWLKSSEALQIESEAWVAAPFWTFCCFFVVAASSSSACCCGSVVEKTTLRRQWSAHGGPQEGPRGAQREHRQRRATHRFLPPCSRRRNARDDGCAAAAALIEVVPLAAHLGSFLQCCAAGEQGVLPVNDSTSCRLHNSCSSRRTRTQLQLLS